MQDGELIIVQVEFEAHILDGFKIHVAVKSGYGIVKNQIPLSMDVTTTVEDSPYLSKLLALGHFEYESQVKKFQTRLVAEIEGQFRKKQIFLDQSDEQEQQSESLDLKY